MDAYYECVRCGNYACIEQFAVCNSCTPGFGPDQFDPPYGYGEEE